MISFGSRHQQFCTKRIPDSKQIKKKQSLEDNKKKITQTTLNISGLMHSTSGMPERLDFAGYATKVPRGTPPFTLLPPWQHDRKYRT